MKNNRMKTKSSNKVPPPPGPGASYDEVIAYHSKYSLDELTKAGYAVEPPTGEIEKLAASATYQLLCENGLQLKLARKDYAQLSRLAAKKDVAVEDLIEAWIKERLRQEVKAKALVRAK